MDLTPIRKLDYRLDVMPALSLLIQPDSDVWDRHKLRTEQYVHSDVSDIWVRFHPWEEDLSLEQFNEPHESVWYPIAWEMPELMDLALAVWRKAVTERQKSMKLGGVLITQIPPGGRVQEHVDHGWHARNYDVKHALQIMGHEDQAFCFKGHRLSAQCGEAYEFDNSQSHWVENNSIFPRITMIVCMKEDEQNV